MSLICSASSMTDAFRNQALGIVTPWGQDSRSEAWFWEVSGKRKCSRLPPEYSPTHEVGNAPKKKNSTFAK